MFVVGFDFSSPTCRAIPTSAQKVVARQEAEAIEAMEKKSR
jgi:hypothetical protein